MLFKRKRRSNRAMLHRAVLVTASPDSLIDTASREVRNAVQKPFEAGRLVAMVRRVSGK